MLTGDHVLPSITPHVSGVRRADSLKSYLATLDLVGQLPGVKIGLPAHGHPFADVPGRVEAIKEHHAERMEQLRDVGLALGPATVVDLSHELFPEAPLGHDGRERDVRAPRTSRARGRRGTVGGERDARLSDGTGAGVVMTATDTELANESVDLLSQLIRNECVNDGTPESGFESRSADLLAQYLGDSGSRPRALRSAARPREPRRADRRHAIRPHRPCC